MIAIRLAIPAMVENKVPISFIFPMLRLLGGVPPGRGLPSALRPSFGYAALGRFVTGSEVTEATGLSPLLPLESLAAERATSGSVDIGGPLQTAMGLVELNATAFISRVAHPVQVSDAPDITPFGAARIRLANAAQPTRTWGLELLGRFVRELGEEVNGVEAPALRVTGTYTFLRSTECDPGVASGGDACVRRTVPLTPRHTAGVVAAIEREGKSRLGLEVYYTGRQALDENPYRR